MTTMWSISVTMRDVFIVWISLVCCTCEARHVPLSAQRGGAESRPRLLVIRPPKGSSQPNRVVILTNPRPEGSQVDASRGISLASIPGLSTVVESPAPTGPPGDGVGGHPQSQARRSEEPASGRRSLRNLLEALSNQRKNRQEPASNIARLSETIPRAAPPMLPTENRFGNLNIPRVIEAALKRAREKARMMGNVRPASSASGHVHQPDLHSSSVHSHGDGVDLTGLHHHNSAATRQFMKSKAINPANENTRNGKDTSSSFTGSGLRSVDRGNENRSGRRRGHVANHNHNHNRNVDERNNGHLDVQLNASTNTTGVHNTSTSEVAAKSRIVKTNINVATKTGGTLTPVMSNKSSGAFHSLSNSNSANANSNSNSNAISSGLSSVAGSAKKPVATLSTNLTAKIDAASANTTSNTTSTKSVKTKTIKVTTVVKGGTAADVAAAAASQAEIAHAVSQGKEINSTAIAEIARKAAEKSLKNSQLPAGSISVKRLNGMSVITLADGIGEPVVIRTTGPVKIERIIKPDGRVQFVINPVDAPTTKPPRTTMAISAEVEPEEFFTTTSVMSTTQIIPTSTSVYYPFVTDTSISPIDMSTVNAKAFNLVKPLVQTTTTIKPVIPVSEIGVNGTGPDITPKSNTPAQMWPVFESPRIPRPPPRIPRPPKVPDTMHGSVRSITPAADVMPKYDVVENSVNGRKGK